MVERLDSLGRHIPQEIEVTPRQWAVTVGRVAEEILSQRYGFKPPEALIVSYLEKIKDTREEHVVLKKRASLLVEKEFMDEVEKLIKEGVSLSAAQRQAKQLIRERYEEIEKDSQRNFAFLDPILFSREGRQAPI